jgi:copper(I)-binding protein
MKNKKIILTSVCTVLAVLIVLFLITRGRPKITVEEAKLIRSAAMKNAASVFMLIINNGGSSDILRGCSIKAFPSAKGELHDVVKGKMTKLKEIEIPANEITLLKRGSLHLMFFELPEKLTKKVTLIADFKKSGSIEVMANTLIVK